jgi:heme exporter protein D
VFTRAAWGLEQDDSSSVGIASASEDAQTLKVIGGSDVASVQRSRIVYLVGTRPLPAAQRRRLLRQQQRQLRAAVQQITSCPLLNTPDKGLQFANVSEVVPYGIDMVEAATPEMIEISKQHRRKVLYCVIDTGERQQNINTADWQAAMEALDTC